MNPYLRNLCRALCVALLSWGSFVAAHAQTDFTAQDAAPGGNVPAAQAGYDPRIHILTPAADQIFHSGDRVTIIVAIDPSLKGKDFYVEAPGIGNIPGENPTPSNYEANLMIPKDFAGAVTLGPGMVLEDGTFQAGLPTVINVKPSGELLGLALVQTNYQMKAPGEEIALQLTGVYANNAVWNITTAATGTIYKSSNPNILTVTQDGVVDIVGYGTASVSAQNGKFEDFATFIIEDPAHPLPPVEVTREFAFKMHAPQLDRTTGYYTQVVEINNVVLQPAIGPLFFVPGGLPSSMRLIDSYPSQLLQPKGTPYIPLPLAKGTSIPARGKIELTLQFQLGNPGQLKYIPQIFRSATPL